MNDLNDAGNKANEFIKNEGRDIVIKVIDALNEGISSSNSFQELEGTVKILVFEYMVKDISSAIITKFLLGLTADEEGLKEILAEERMLNSMWKPIFDLVNQKLKLVLESLKENNNETVVDA